MPDRLVYVFMAFYEGFYEKADGYSILKRTKLTIAGVSTRFSNKSFAKIGSFP